MPAMARSKALELLVEGWGIVEVALQRTTSVPPSEGQVGIAAEQFPDGSTFQCTCGGVIAPRWICDRMHMR